MFPVNITQLSSCWFIVEDLIEMVDYERLGIERYILGRKSIERRCPLGEEFRDKLITTPPCIDHADTLRHSKRGQGGLN